MFLIDSIEKAITKNPTGMATKIYKTITKSKKRIILFTVLYCLSPIDLIPDFFFGLGEMDDLGVLVISVLKLIEQFISKPNAIEESKKLEMNHEA